MAESDSFDRYLPEQARTYIEETYYARVQAQAQFQAILNDPEFLAAPETHPALFSDHGVVHVRDVARHILHVLNVINGVLIPARESHRFERLKSYGLSVAYLHDIGMIDFSAIGRAMHPEFAAQAVFAPESDELIQTIWSANRGGLADDLIDLQQQKTINVDPQIVLREMLALSMCHSKSKVPVQIMNDPAALRSLIQISLTTNLGILYRQQQVEKLRAPNSSPRAVRDAQTALALARHSTTSDRQRDNLKRFYTNFEQDSFRWLIAEPAAGRLLADDVIDTLRALRCADALRQRGTVLKTSASYEVFVDQSNAEAVYALRLDRDHLFLVSAAQAISAGEANIAGSELDLDGNLRISFQRGTFATPEVTRYAAECAAIIVNDIQSDVIESFRRPPSESGSRLKTPSEILILLEGAADSLDFTEWVSEQLVQLNPALQAQIHTVPSLENASEVERARYLAAADLDWSIDQRRELLLKVAESGQRIDHIDPDSGFRQVRFSTLHAGESLLGAGASASFVYIPLTEGLNILPLGGYEPFSVAAWMPLGVTGVIRGAERNASIVAKKDVPLLIIPKEIYLKHWYQPHNLADLIVNLRGKNV